MDMTLREKLEVTRVIVSVFLLITAIYGVFNSSVGWGWFLLVGAVLYPSQINIDFRES